MRSLFFRHAVFRRAESDSLGFGFQLAVDGLAHKERVWDQSEEQRSGGCVED